MIDFVQVGNKIAKYRKDKKLSQEELADQLFVTRQALSKWENGTSVPSVDTLLELSKLFKVSFEDLLCINDDKNIEVDPNNIFENHDRNYIIERIIKGEIKVNVCDVLYQMSPTERLSILKAIKESKIKIQLEELMCKLTPSEQRYLLGGVYYELVQIKR